jgi:hypothetical protein
MIEEMGFVITRGTEASEPPCETVAGRGERRTAPARRQDRRRRLTLA